MGVVSTKILIGIFSYNEGENLRTIYYELKRQCAHLNCNIVLVDESDEYESLAIVNKIIQEDNVTNIRANYHRRGKVHGYNLLYNYFIKTDCDILLHFDADHILSCNAVSYLAKAIDSGFDIATCLNKPLKGENFFQRILYIMMQPPTMQREIGTFKLPLVGHNGAYNRKAVTKLGEIPIGGVDEEMYVVYKVTNNDLSYTIETKAISYYALPGTLPDYVKTTRRVYGRVKAFEEYIVKNYLRTAISEKMLIEDMIYSKPPFKLILKSLFSDLIASFFVPYVYLIRWAIMKGAKTYTTDTWDSVKTTKKLTRS